MAARSRHSLNWTIAIGALAVVAALILWLLFTGRASTPTATVDLRPEAPSLPTVEPPTLPAPSQPPAPVG